MEVPPPSRRLKRLWRLARLFDAGFRVPGTRWEIGLDPLIGLLPGIGDAVGAAVAGYILIEAARSGASGPVLLRMLFNIAVDTLVGSVPVVGDVFDAAWKANLKNVRLLERYSADPSAVHRASGRMVSAILLSVALLLVGTFALGVLLFRALLRAAIR